ncbi:MAG: hypothetical protein M3345_05370 [Actinomycetota bacterium]|nr:hypothetical protein [Actinomycetota bacterium]
MRERMLRWAPVLFLVLPLACGSAGGTGTPRSTQANPQAEVAEVKTTLEAAVTAGKAYGRKKLGHYLKMDAKDLVKAGLEIPDGISLEVRPGHTGFCISALDISLPDDHPWARSTVDGRLGLPSQKDRCSKK